MNHILIIRSAGNHTDLSEIYADRSDRVLDSGMNGTRFVSRKYIKHFSAAGKRFRLIRIYGNREGGKVRYGRSSR